MTSFGVQSLAASSRVNSPYVFVAERFWSHFGLMSPDLRNLLVSDVLIRFCEQIPYAFVVIWAMEKIRNPVAAWQFGILTAIEMTTAVLIYIPVAYLADRATLGDVPEIDGVSAGGMPTRVKCLHVLVGHALAAGPGVTPLGDEALAALGDFWTRPCLEENA